MNLCKPLQVQPPTVSLIGHRGIGVTITKDDLPFPEVGKNDPAKMLNPVGGVQEEFRHGFNPTVLGRKEDLPNALPQRAASGFPGEEKGAMNFLEKGSEAFTLSRFPASFNSLEGNEKAQFSLT